MSNPTQFKQGDIVAHYKSFYNTDEDFADKKYLYTILYPEAYTSEDEPIKCVVYQALYGEKKVWIRHYDEFMSEINVEGNPFKYRFNKMDIALNTIFNLTEVNRNNRAYNKEAILKVLEEFMEKKEE